MAGEGDVDKAHQSAWGNSVGLQTEETRQLYNDAKQYLAANAKGTFIDERGLQQTLFVAKDKDFNDASVYSEYRNNSAYREYYWNVMGDNLKPDNPTPQELAIYNQRQRQVWGDGLKATLPDLAVGVLTMAAGRVAGRMPVVQKGAAAKEIAGGKNPSGANAGLPPLRQAYVDKVKATSLYTSLTDRRRASKNSFTFNGLAQPL